MTPNMFLLEDLQQFLKANHLVLSLGRSQLGWWARLQGESTTTTSAQPSLVAAIEDVLSLHSGADK